MEEDDPFQNQPQDDFSVSVYPAPSNKTTKSKPNKPKSTRDAIAKAFPKTEFSTTLDDAFPPEEFPEEDFPNPYDQPKNNKQASSSDGFEADFGELGLVDKDATSRFDSSFGQLQAQAPQEMSLNDEASPGGRESRKDRKSSSDKSRGRSRSKGRLTSSKDGSGDDKKRRGRSKSSGPLEDPKRDKRRGRSKSSGPLGDGDKRESRRTRGKSAGRLAESGDGGGSTSTKEPRKSRDRSRGPLEKKKSSSRDKSKGPVDDKVKEQAKERARRERSRSRGPMENKPSREERKAARGKSPGALKSRSRDRATKDQGEGAEDEDTVVSKDKKSSRGKSPGALSRRAPRRTKSLDSDAPLVASSAHSMVSTATVSSKESTSDDKTKQRGAPSRRSLKVSHSETGDRIRKPKSMMTMIPKASGHSVASLEKPSSKPKSSKVLSASSKDKAKKKTSKSKS